MQVTSFPSLETLLAPFHPNQASSPIKLGLDRMKRLMAALGNPQNQYPCLHVAGTNGKGTVCNTLSQVLTQAGFKTGLTISPHLTHLTERFQMNHRRVPETLLRQSLITVLDTIQTCFEKTEEQPTYFEVLTATAFQLFASEQVDIAIIEVGLGGRLDATNVIETPLASIITSIGLDHQDWLGESIEAIAGEKAGIVKPNCPLILGPTLKPDTPAGSIIHQVAQPQGAPLILTPNPYFTAVQHEVTSGLTTLTDPNQQVWEVPLSAPYQLSNIATALTALRLLQQEQTQDQAQKETSFATKLNAHLSQYFSRPSRLTPWPGRFHYFPKSEMLSYPVLLDGAHNPDGFEALADGLETHFKDWSFSWLVSLRDNRNPDDLLNLIQRFPKTQQVFWTKPEHQNPAIFWDIPPTSSINLHATATPTEGLIFLREAPPQSGHRHMIVITGSLYLVGECLPLLA